MVYTIEELHQKLYEKVYAVYDVFKDFFGEEYTDLQNLEEGEDLKDLVPVEYDMDGTHFDISDTFLNDVRRTLQKPVIMVHWPTVRITNEHDKYIDIKDLYAKITLTIDGTIPYEYHGFELIRSTYNRTQFFSRYMHSHVPSIDLSRLDRFMMPCLGRGPINNTIASLKNNCDEITWMLFCQELNMYVTVESLAGVPYRKLEEVEERDYLIKNDFEEIERCSYSPLSNDMVKSFIEYYLRNGHLCIGYRDGDFVPGMSYFDFMIDISNSFIDFYNRHDISLPNKAGLYDNVLKEVAVRGRKFYQRLGGMTVGRMLSYVGRHVCTFKGQDITLQIKEEPEESENVTTILRHVIAMNILYRILRTINYRYKDERTRDTEEAASASQEAIYL